MEAIIEQETIRPLGYYPETVWVYEDFASFSANDSAFESYTEQVDELKMQVKDMLINLTTDPVEKLKLIDALCRLGVSYQVKSEIEDQMNLIFNLQLNLDDRDYDLYTVALVLRVFRQHGFKMSFG
ncbi:casbene synthase, chloroplastic-like [Tripterygium wilfordii]|uniref:casbene synthase, chloroplastic-like n=1 Tax=Tripterygium wilfordii TaxID=458696 RepID=UPI0018F862E8|nr:casbene synthase, chloroplastic-like [Tripterygium wilfordii]